MKPLILHPDWVHYGLCKHYDAVPPDQIVIIESTVFGADQTHVGFWIGRKAEAPWDVLSHDDPKFRWHTCRQPMSH